MTAPHYSNFQNLVISFEYFKNLINIAGVPLFKKVDFYPKTFLIVYPSLENSTTGNAILPIHKTRKLQVQCLAVVS